MSGLWDQAGIPHKGWTCIAVEDVGENTERCEMCGNETVRYIHIVTHAAGHELRVGCICAGKLSDDYEGARARERDLVNRSARREKWLSRRWRVSAKGNSYLKAKGHRVVIFAVGKRWGASVDGHASPNTWPSQDAAKLKAFDHLWPAPSKRTG